MFARTEHRLRGRVEPDEADLRLFAAGDEGALGRIYYRYYGPMLVVALRTVGRHDLAADIVQQAFLQAWRSAASLAPGTPIAPWLFTITTRCAIDLWRKESRQEPVDPSSPTFAASVPPGTDGLWEAWQVRRALARLDPGERELIRLAYFDQLSQSEIATRLGMPLGTVKSRTRRGQAHLAELLAHLGPAPSSEVEA